LPPVFLEHFTPTLAVVSPFLPNQIFFAITCLVTFTAIRLWTWARAANLWKGPFRAVALVNLWMALSITLFIVSGLVPLLQPWQPVVHMLQEIGTMGAFCYLAFKVTDLLPTVAARRSLDLVLKASPVVFGACWTTAAILGWRHPFPMTGIFVDLPTVAFFYRAILLVPGLIYTGLIAELYRRDLKLANAVGADPGYVRRMTFFFLGSLVFCVTCADLLVWSYLLVYASPATLHLLAIPQVIAEDVLWALMGITWMLGIIAPYQSGAVGRSMSDYRRFLRRLRHLKTELLINLPREVPHRRTTTAYLRDAAAVLGMPPIDAARGEKVFELVAARSTGATDLSDDDLSDLSRLYEQLLCSLPEDSPEKRNLGNDPLPAAIASASRSPSSDHDRGEGPGVLSQWAQLGYLAANDLGLLSPRSTPYLEPAVTRAYAKAKRDDTRLAY
jgi:hypothetical protein